MYTQLEQRGMSDPPVNVSTLGKMKQEGVPIACLTAYDASYGALVDAAHADLVLVGDSLGMVVQGHDTTVPVTVEDIIYHTRAVARGLRHAFLVADMPFMSYTNPEQALENSVRLMQEGGAMMIKLEGGAGQVAIVEHLARHDIPVCAHLGLKPQSVHKIGGFKVQGRDADEATAIADSARRLQDAGADIVLLECVPNEIGKVVTESLSVPVIGIGAGPDVDGQILVLYDVLDITLGRTPKFVRNFQTGHDSPLAALQAYVSAVKKSRVSGTRTLFFLIMQSLQHRTELAALVSGWRSAGERIAVVPTMGNLHEGHLSLVRLAQANADRVIVTLFVNPTQFGDGEDFEIYPRTLQQDTRLLQALNIDVLFAPDVQTVYPFGIENATRVSVPGLSDDLCGSSRPGHFDGVTTVVIRLLTLTQPDIAVFGQKDYQQQLVIRRMVEDLGLPLEIISGPIVREPDGLAMSSRKLKSKRGRPHNCAVAVSRLARGGSAVAGWRARLCRNRAASDDKIQGRIY